MVSPNAFFERFRPLSMIGAELILGSDSPSNFGLNEVEQKRY